MLTTFVMTMRGTTFYYNGDELGMSNIRFDNIDDYNDVDTRNAYFGLKQKGGDLSAFLEDKKQTSRENSRTPIQWNAGENAGFTTGKPWLRVNENHRYLNAEVQEKDPNSVLNYFRKIVKLRKDNPVLVYGKYTLLDKDNPNVYSYTRELDGKKILIALNFSANNAVYEPGFSLEKSKIISDNYSELFVDNKNNTILRPYEAMIIEIN
jgi:oligo-1,6-glucosidase